MATDIPTAGSAMRVAAVAPFLNARGERDSDLDLEPDDWTGGGGTLCEIRRSDEYGLSSDGSAFLKLVNSSVTLTTPPDVVPIGTGMSVQGELVFYFKGYAASSVRGDVVLRMHTSAGATDSTATDSDFADWAAGPTVYWTRERLGVPDFTASDVSRSTLELSSSYLFQVYTDTPVLGWRADGDEDANNRWYTMESPPSGASVTPGMTGSMTRDASGGMFYADPYGASSKWKLSLNYEYMSDADYQYWCACYAVSRGASGYMNASGGQLDPQPIAVEHFLFDVATATTDSANASPPIIVGNITSFDLSVREYLGFGYQGSITIEEA